MIKINNVKRVSSEVVEYQLENNDKIILLEKEINEIEESHNPATLESIEGNKYLAILLDVEYSDETSEIIGFEKITTTFEEVNSACGIVGINQYGDVDEFEQDLRELEDNPDFTLLGHFDTTQDADEELQYQGFSLDQITKMSLNQVWRCNRMPTCTRQSNILGICRSKMRAEKPFLFTLNYLNCLLNYVRSTFAQIIRKTVNKYGNNY